VHRARNLYAKLPERERERVKHAYWQALDDAINDRDAKQQLQALVDELDKAGYTAAARCLADDLDALVVHLRYPTRHRRRWRSTDESVKARGSISWVCELFSPCLWRRLVAVRGSLAGRDAGETRSGWGVRPGGGVRGPRPEGGVVGRKRGRG
jgi:hypothetical protein